MEKPQRWVHPIGLQFAADLPFDEDRDVTHEAIKQALSTGCTESEFAAIRCPVCGGKVTFHVHPWLRMFYVRCAADTTHMAMHGGNPAAPDWWGKHVEHASWLS